MTETFIEVRITGPVDAEELAILMEQTGISGVWESEACTYLYWPEKLWTTRTLDSLRQALIDLPGETVDRSITVHPLPDRDWNAEWAKNVAPIRIGRSVLITQSWNPADLPGGIILKIDPKRAFGTGYHATTQLIIEMLEQRIRPGDRVLDVGTGSGILAMVSLRLGARSALGIDSDPEAIECAREYAEMNGFGAELELEVLSLVEMDRTGYEIVVANLDLNTLRHHRDDLLRCLPAGGALMVSGVLEEDEQEFLETYSLPGVNAVSRFERDGWIAVEFVVQEPGTP